MSIRQLVLYSLLASLGALSCTQGSQLVSQPSKRAAQPGIIPVEDPLDAEAFQSLSTAYLLAACEGDPFAKKYEPIGGHLAYLGLPKDMQQALQALIKYVRTGGREKQQSQNPLKRSKSLHLVLYCTSIGVRNLTQYPVLHLLSS